MKHGIELNGVANIKLIMQSQVGNHDDGTFVMDADAYDTIMSQLETLERYMLAYCNAINKEQKPPYWHEVRDNQFLFPNNRGE